MSYADIPLASDFSTLKVGEVYMVPCVAQVKDNMGWPLPVIPVFPVLASDEPVFTVKSGREIHTEQRHYHVDVRFMARGYPQIITLDRLKDSGKLTLWPQLCRYRHVERHHSKSVVVHTRESITKHLHACGKTAAARIGDKVYCPHKGARIDICPTTDWNGVKAYQCPLHGATFDRVRLNLL